MDPDSRRRWRACPSGARTRCACSCRTAAAARARRRAGPVACRGRPARARGEVAVALVTDARVRKLNRNSAGRTRRPTCSPFPFSQVSAFDRLEPPRVLERRTSDPDLGDIVIATGVARRQAREAGHSYHTELRVLALHGLLHLLGYDHHDRPTAAHGARRSAAAAQGRPARGLIERSERRRRP